MVREAVFVVVGLVVLGAFIVLAVRDRRLRARVRRLEREVGELSRTIATVQGWAAKEIGAVRGEFTVARVNASAADVLALIAKRSQQRAASAATPPALVDDPDEQREAIAMPPPSGPALTLATEDGEATTVIDPEPPRYARHSTMRPSAPLAHPDLIGSEDAADEAASMRLGPEDKTPPRRGRAVVLVSAFGPEEGGAA